MVTSLSGLVSQVANHLSGGLRGQQNFTYSLEQIADQLVQVRGDLIRTAEGKGTPYPLKAYQQVCPSIQLRPRDWVTLNPTTQALLASLPVPASRTAWFYARIPRLLSLDKTAIDYFGPAGRPEPWTVVEQLGALAYDQYRRLPRRTPLVYVEGQDLWVTGRDGRVPVICKLIAGFADPRQPARMGLSDEFHPFTIGPDVDQTEDSAAPPAWPVSEDLAERSVNRVLQSFYPTHGTRPVPVHDGTAAI